MNLQEETITFLNQQNNWVQFKNAIEQLNSVKWA